MKLHDAFDEGPQWADVGLETKMCQALYGPLMVVLVWDVMLGGTGWELSQVCVCVCV